MYLADATYDTPVPRILLLLPTATYRANDFLAAARKLEVDVVVASEQPQTMAEMMGDRSLLVDFDRPETSADAIARRAKEVPLDAVVGVDEQGVLVAALAATRLGLIGNPPEAVAATTNKITMRKAFSAAELPQPAHRIAGTDVNVARLAGEVGFPCVVKPISMSASRGVIRADDPSAALVAALRIRQILADAGQDKDAPLLIERYVPGVEVAVEGLLRGGVLETLAIFDKPDPLDGPYFEESIYVTPSRLPTETLDAISQLTASAAAALGLLEGPVHAEVRIDSDRLWILELAARSIGGLCSRSLRTRLGLSLEELILRHALGMPLYDRGQESEASGVMMLPIPKAGALREVRGQAYARATPGVDELDISIPIGRTVRTLPEADRYLGFLFAHGKTPEAVEHTLRSAHGELEIVIDDPSE
ncbi:MAG: ATP-grasp domain-containing protein [Thermoleophilia bacterium]|nr:ATP-grasp domain-containing protein [Thermoleophilia bacterium]